MIQWCIPNGENEMWRIQKKEKFDIWENDLCSLKVQYEENKCRVYVNYKGYNVVIPMGMYGFEDEIQERKIMQLLFLIGENIMKKITRRSFLTVCGS